MTADTPRVVRCTCGELHEVHAHVGARIGATVAIVCTCAPGFAAGRVLGCDYCVAIADELVDGAPCCAWHGHEPAGVRERVAADEESAA